MQSLFSVTKITAVFQLQKSIEFTDKTECFFSSRLNRDHPLTRRLVQPPPPLWFRGWGYTFACGRGGGGPNSNEGTDTVVLYGGIPYMYFVIELDIPLF